MTMEKHEQLSFVLKREIVQRLARFDTPGQVVKAMKVDHGLDLSPQRVQFYDPTSKNGAALGEEFKVLLHETRKRFLEDLDAIPIANKAVRLRRLDRMAALAEERGNMVRKAMTRIGRWARRSAACRTVALSSRIRCVSAARPRKSRGCRRTPRLRMASRA